MGICGARMILPASCMLSHRVLEVDYSPFASGGYGDVREGALNGSKVCVKRIRVDTHGVAQKAAKVSS